jgi:hypothetical protein
MRRLFCAFILVLIPVIACSHDFSFSFPDTAIYRASNIREIPVYFDNFHDTIAGVILQVELSPPGIIEFGFDDLHRYLPFDTAGTLMSGWELISTYSQDNDKQDIVLYALANTVPPPYNPGFAPQQGGKLINLRFRTLPIPDSLRSITVNITFKDSSFSMANPQGQSFGIIVDTVITCLQYVGDSCVLYDSTTVGRLDTNIVMVKNGSILVVNYQCGDINLDRNLNLLDVTCLLYYLYKPGQYHCPGFPCDMNQDDMTNILDLTYLIQYLYRGGPPPP